MCVHLSRSFARLFLCLLRALYKRDSQQLVLAQKVRLRLVDVRRCHHAWQRPFSTKIFFPPPPPTCTLPFSVEFFAHPLSHSSFDIDWLPPVRCARVTECMNKRPLVNRKFLLPKSRKVLATVTFLLLTFGYLPRALRPLSSKSMICFSSVFGASIRPPGLTLSSTQLSKLEPSGLLLAALRRFASPSFWERRYKTSLSYTVDRKWCTQLRLQPARGSRI